MPEKGGHVGRAQVCFRPLHRKRRCRRRETGTQSPRTFGGGGRVAGTPRVRTSTGPRGGGVGAWRVPHGRPWEAVPRAGGAPARGVGAGRVPRGRPWEVVPRGGGVPARGGPGQPEAPPGGGAGGAGVPGAAKGPVGYREGAGGGAKDAPGVHRTGPALGV